MTPLTIGIAALVLGLVFGSIAVWGAPIFALPIVLLVLAALGLGLLQRLGGTSMAAHRRDAAQGVEFSERDRETLT